MLGYFFKHSKSEFWNEVDYLLRSKDLRLFAFNFIREKLFLVDFEEYFSTPQSLDADIVRELRLLEAYFIKNQNHPACVSRWLAQRLAHHPDEAYRIFHASLNVESSGLFQAISESLLHDSETPIEVDFGPIFSLAKSDGSRDSVMRARFLILMADGAEAYRQALSEEEFDRWRSFVGYSGLSKLSFYFGMEVARRAHHRRRTHLIRGSACEHWLGPATDIEG